MNPKRSQCQIRDHALQMLVRHAGFDVPVHDDHRLAGLTVRRLAVGWDAGLDTGGILAMRGKPQHMASLAAHEIQKFNDLPPEFRANVNTSEVPYNRSLGDAPALSDAEIDDVIAFLKTLSDGYAP